MKAKTIDEQIREAEKRIQEAVAEIDRLESEGQGPGRFTDRSTGVVVWSFIAVMAALAGMAGYFLLR
jgi:hypothetical protein